MFNNSDLRGRVTVSYTPESESTGTPPKPWWRRWVHWIRPQAQSREALLDTLAQAEDHAVIGVESRIMLEGVIRMADMTAAQVMVPAPRMDLIDIHAPMEETLHQVIETRHSRFPVYEDDKDNVIGILLAKDLLKLQRAPELNLRTLLRQPVLIPESKRLNDLLREFRNNRNHMALVVDEFGRIAGLITIEDVLEEIVGEIADEFDEQQEGVVGEVFTLADHSYRVSGDAAIERVCQALQIPPAVFALAPDDSEFDTVGGYIAHAMGHVPRKGEVWMRLGWRFEVLHTRAGSVKWFKVKPVAVEAAPGDWH